MRPYIQQLLNSIHADVHVNAHTPGGQEDQRPVLDCKPVEQVLRYLAKFSETLGI